MIGSESHHQPHVCVSRTSYTIILPMPWCWRGAGVVLAWWFHRHVLTLLLRRRSFTYRIGDPEILALLGLTLGCDRGGGGAVKAPAATWGQPVQ